MLQNHRHTKLTKVEMRRNNMNRPKASHPHYEFQLFFNYFVFLFVTLHHQMHNTKIKQLVLAMPLDQLKLIILVSH